MSGIIEYASRSSQLEAAASIAAQTGAEIRSVMALMANNRLSFLFDDRHILRRIDRADPVVARRYLADVRRRWEQREEHRGYGIWVLRQCSACGFGHTGPPAGAGTATCQRCGSDLAPDASTRDWPTVPVDGSQP